MMRWWRRKTREVTPRSLEDDPPSLSLRTQPSAGGIAEAMAAKPTDPLATKRRVTLFIHGFNVDEAAAREAYRAMRQSLPAHKRDDIVWLMWPGDMFDNSIASAAAYSFILDRIPACRVKTAEYLTAALSTNPHPEVELRVIAHSLGCRLTLEVLTLLRFFPKVKLEYIALMAAAVPLYKVRAGGDLDIATFGGPKVDVFRSVADIVLMGAFGPGQRVESDGASSAVRHRSALGLRGFGPDTLATLPTVTETPTNLGHGGYWGSKMVATKISRALPVTDRREVTLRTLTPRPRTQGRSIFARARDVRQ